MADQVEIRTGAYYDSVSLMQVSRSVAAAPGVEAAQVAMATELNLDVIRGMGFDLPEAGPNDLVIAIRGDESGIAAGKAALDDALAGLRSAAAQSGGFGEAPPPRTLGGAVRRADANLALVRRRPARDDRGARRDDALVSVMIFSDNVPVEDEVRLKDLAAAGELVMGPDCGTAVVAGSASASPTSSAPGPSASSRPRAPARSRSCASSTPPAWASATSSASAAATCPPRSRAAPPSRPSPRSPPTPPPRASSSSPSLLPLGCCPTSSRMPLGSASRSTGPRSGPGARPHRVSRLRSW